MAVRRLVLGSLIAGAGLILTRQLLATTGPAEPAPDRSPHDEIDAYLESQMRRLKMPGLALAIVEGDRVVHRRGFGRARPGGEAPSPQTPFVLGSTTKSITATAVMQLVEAGKVDLDASVQRYLPWFRVADPQASAQMTVRHLLNQTSGLPMVPGLVLLADLDDRPNAAERQARTLSTLKLTRPVGAAFEYSNLNYNLLGLIVDAASGESYVDYIQAHIFTPLGMSHSYTSQAAARQDGLAVGHRYWFAHPVAIPDLPIPRGSLASGQLNSSSEDMAHYLIAHLNGGRYKDAEILSSTGIDEMHRVVAEQRVMGAYVAAYGMGWWVSTIGRTTVVSHGGIVPDFSSYMALLPEQQKGAVLLVNACHFGLPFVLPEVGDGVAALLAGEQPPPIRLGFLPWVMAALPLLPLAQIAGAAAALLQLRSRRLNAVLSSSGGRTVAQRILLPLLPNISAAALLAILKRKGVLPYLRLFNPDLYWIARVGGSLGLVVSFLLPALICRAVRDAGQGGSHHKCCGAQERFAISN